MIKQITVEQSGTSIVSIKSIRNLIIQVSLINIQAKWLQRIVS